MIVIVYHVFCYDNWKQTSKSQLDRLVKSGLYDSVDEFHMTVNLNGQLEEDVRAHFSEYEKIKIECFELNAYEYPGIKKVKDICDVNDDAKVLYFHAKGVSNKYRRHDKQDEISEVKINGINSWREVLEYYLIDNWKDCIEKLNEYDNVGVTCDNGWFWGNFWWSTSKHIKSRPQPLYGAGRWYFEAWLNEGQWGKNYEYYKFTFNPYRCAVAKEFYDGTYAGKIGDLEILEAKYGSFDIQTDEGRPANDKIVELDVIDLVRDHYEKNKNIDGISVNNEPFGEDPIFGAHKQLRLVFRVKGFEKVHEIVFDEYRTTYLAFI
jgi:hypothetical protein